MKNLSIIAITTLLLGLSNAALAKSHICTTKENYTRYIADKTVFVCTGNLPNMTAEEITSKGYRIVNISVNDNVGYIGVNGEGYFRDWVIVIEK